MLNITEETKKAIEKVLGTAQLDTTHNGIAWLELTNDVLKLRVDLKFWDFPMKLDKAIDGMLKCRDCNIRLHSASEATEMMLENLSKLYQDT
ncbi:hypothetical protein [Vibrio parahaemolyticus]|uniref:hypothetical protein n=1 Tax=Vibrio parahaemolyticus TaxID=670 RepID=UPI000988F387|nr:hypothetical protein [Vibrio parahaemolyticus]EGR0904393.1 hypothetical protein [Vibrio parahaemolyticus]EJI1393388.1 hypothetical protein [Vibrio parahaemolyticus]OOQ67067.1 hypothetical protein BSR59_01010 [Vibrio parahaemolyticus]OOQ72785.1 hypothetical protein BSR63_21415 [Vibrio parahaemolyticus]QEL40325.1 hypothetical protein BSR23_009570 [Vibrio parahaemolyticus]